MEKFKILSGNEIVAKGATKIEVSLPEIGLKDVKPDGSWLEQKQIQSALEARKHLVEAQRIEKSGVLSHAEWKDELKLAEVTQQCGGYWHFLGHHRDRKLYLRPEEALYLMEVNCLLLKYSGVTVSLQQAYSLLLSDDISVIQYKVYASLSRVGYKVFKYVSKPEETNTAQTNQKNKNTSETNQGAKDTCLINQKDKSTCETNQESVTETEKKESGVVESPSDNFAGDTEEKSSKGNESNTTEQVNVTRESEECKFESETSKKEIEGTAMDIDTQTDTENKQKQSNDTGNAEEFMDVDNNVILSNSLGIQSSTCLLNSRQAESNDISNDGKIYSDESTSHRNNSPSMDPLRRYCQWKLQKLKSRQEKSCKPKDVHKHFENCPDLLENKIVTIKVPKEELIPKNIFLNNLCYVLNVDNIRKKNNTPVPTESTYCLADEVNGAHIRRVTNSDMFNRPNPQTQSNNLPHFYQNFRPNMPFRNFGYFRPRANSHFFQFNLFYQRPFMGNFNPRFQFFPRMHMPMFPGYTNNVTNSVSNDSSTQNNAQSRRRQSPKTLHFEAIKNLAVKLRQLSHTGSMRPEFSGLQALQRIINTYNVRYRARLRLTEEFEIVNDETIVDTIELDDDDEESKAKKPRLADKSDSGDENLNKIRQIALKLRTLEAQNKTSARHRRALSSLIKTFNKSFNADIYMNDDCEVLDRRHINLDSDSDSDCVIEVRPIVTGKKLRNPFNILKRLSEKQIGCASRSRKESTDSFQSDSSPQNLHEVLEKTFTKLWLPDDFGRPEVTPRDTMNARIIETKKEEYLLDFYKNESYKFNNWVHVKTAFLENIEDTNAILHTEAMMDNNIDLRSLVRSDDCTDMSAVLKKLRIIKSNKDVNEECNLAIDFDVYNRNVQNFRKADRPKPHFRIVCLDATTACPRGIDVATLHSKFNDNVTILFAVVGIGSISYLQMNPSDLPVYVPCRD